MFHLIHPARPAAIPNWWNVDDAIIGQWNRLMTRISTLYITGDFPSMSDYDGRPIMLTNIHDANARRLFKAFSSEPRPVDALVRFVHIRL